LRSPHGAPELFELRLNIELRFPRHMTNTPGTGLNVAASAETRVASERFVLFVNGVLLLIRPLCTTGSCRS
jgi:hypothetical protein